MAVTGTRFTSLFNDSNGDGKVSPGDTLLTQILIKNATAAALTSVTVNDTLTNNTTYVAGSTVVTVGDQYTGLVGNTPISFVTSEGVLANDYHFDGANAGTNTGLTVTTVDGVAIGGNITIHDAAVPATVAGTVNVAADGSFTFTPATGYVGTAAFTYTDSDGSGTIGSGTVTLTVSSEIWYVDSTYAGGNGTSDGSYLKPFTTFTNLNGAGDKDAPGDTIVVHGSPAAANFVLEAGETLLGDGVLHKVNDAYTVNGVTHNTGATTVTSGS
ncbi:MAG TPA: cadherin-like domain-containing protein, partial [Allosphingosinicella sp.]|nr:cadherin-like domain-containing protein [Allosphingosinicella sp.]